MTRTSWPTRRFRARWRWRPQLSGGQSSPSGFPPQRFVMNREKLRSMASGACLQVPSVAWRAHCVRFASRARSRDHSLERAVASNMRLWSTRGRYSAGLMRSTRRPPPFWSADRCGCQRKTMRVKSARLNLTSIHSLSPPCFSPSARRSRIDFRRWSTPLSNRRSCVSPASWRVSPNDWCI